MLLLLLLSNKFLFKSWPRIELFLDQNQIFDVGLIFCSLCKSYVCLGGGIIESTFTHTIFWSKFIQNSIFITVDVVSNYLQVSPFGRHLYSELVIWRVAMAATYCQTNSILKFKMWRAKKFFLSPNTIIC